MTGVDLFCRDLSDAQDRFAILSEDERARAARYRFEKDRRAFVARRGILREILSGYLDMDPARFEFSYNPYGKPAVDGIHFNISHSAGLALFAVSRSRDVGVDIELRNPSFARGHIAEQLFSPAEVRALRGLPESDQVEAFYNCWTRKEAYVKARGLGLSIPLDSFDVTLAPGEPAAFLKGAGDWSMEALQPAPGYIAALVAGPLRQYGS